MKVGFCNQTALDKTGRELREFLQPDLPPVGHMGECIDNAKVSAFFRALIDDSGKTIKNVPRLQAQNGQMKKMTHVERNLENLAREEKQ